MRSPKRGYTCRNDPRAWTAIGAVGLGGVWSGALAAALSIVALGTLVLVGFLVSAVLKYGLDGED